MGQELFLCIPTSWCRLQHLDLEDLGPIRWCSGRLVVVGVYALDVALRSGCSRMLHARREVEDQRQRVGRAETCCHLVCWRRLVGLGVEDERRYSGFSFLHLVLYGSLLKQGWGFWKIHSFYSICVWVFVFSNCFTHQLQLSSCCILLPSQLLVLFQAPILDWHPSSNSAPGSFSYRSSFQSHFVLNASPH